MFHIGETFKPGQQAPAGGLYQCDAPCTHRFSTSDVGQAAPPMPESCRGHAWRLIYKH
jgi:hypothetical protein